ncbi:MAG: T9SS type A sorting domain-containing protein, partial [Rhodothermales bacterium]
VSDHPAFEKRYRGEGPVVNDLEWDVKAYFVLGGAVHDAAISAWGIKGWYDYIRPISAIRAMADRGQCTDPDLPRYSPGGIPLVDGLIEVVNADDPLAGDGGENVGKIKLKAWRAHAFIADPATESAGVDWILAENWWPYQRQSFVTPPFAGFISGHSTFSRAAAEVMTLLTGDPYFPGGMGEFHAPKNTFLAFEAGPSEDVTLQWATYRDASDQTSLSRIWGGIHPPADDIPGRHIGMAIAADAFDLAEMYFSGNATAAEDDIAGEVAPPVRVYPNPVIGNADVSVVVDGSARDVDVRLYNLLGQSIWAQTTPAFGRIVVPTAGLASGAYVIVVRSGSRISSHNILLVR